MRHLAVRDALYHWQDLHTGAGLSKTGAPSLAALHAAYKPYAPIAVRAVARAQQLLDPALGKEGDVGALLKAAAEVMLLAGESSEVCKLLKLSYSE